MKEKSGDYVPNENDFNQTADALNKAET